MHESLSLTHTHTNEEEDQEEEEDQLGFEMVTCFPTWSGVQESRTALRARDCLASHRVSSSSATSVYNSFQSS